MKKPRPSVFIGSSQEGLPYARAIANELETKAHPTVWDQDVFRPMKGTLEQLEEIKHSFHYAVLVMTPDDTTIIRKKTLKTSRDNVVFELGLFIGALGRWRVFFVTSQSDINKRIPTDLLGITALYYSPLSKGNVRASVRACCKTICAEMKRCTNRRGSLLDGSAFDVRFWHTIGDREAYGNDARALIVNSKQMVIITGISLNYIVRSCSGQLRDALARGVLVGIFVANESRALFDYYERYSRLASEAIPMAHKLYVDFSRSLDADQRKLFAFYDTDIPLTHSVGVYDKSIFVSEFCIDQPSSLCPSYSPRYGSHSYAIILREIAELIKRSNLVCGAGQNAIRRSVALYQ